MLTIIEQIYCSFFSNLECFFNSSKIGTFVFIVIGGDWNCTLDFKRDRNGEEPHVQSASCLVVVLKNLIFSDVWRQQNASIKQYTWVKINYGRVSGAHLDMFCVSNNVKYKVVHAAIFPSSLSDHKLITVVCTLVNRTHKTTIGT